MDGAEFYRDCEYNVWSLSSVLSSGDVPRHFLTGPEVCLPCLLHASLPLPISKVHDIKFPLVIIPHVAMKKHTVTGLHCGWFQLTGISYPVAPDLKVRRGIHSIVAKLLEWSLSFCGSGIHPTEGFQQESFDKRSYRYERRGKRLYGDWRSVLSKKLMFVMVYFWKCPLSFKHLSSKTLILQYPDRAAYWAFRYDGKARVECNAFSRYYNCTKICESCMAERRTKNSDINMWYCDFRASSPRHLTQIDDGTYKRTANPISPYHCIPGWKLGTCLRDLLHVVFLGTAKDLIPSLLADWLDHGLLGGPRMSIDDKLRCFSLEMHRVFKREKFPGLFEFLQVYFFIQKKTPSW